MACRRARETERQEWTRLSEHLKGELARAREDKQESESRRKQQRARARQQSVREMQEQFIADRLGDLQ